MQPDGSPKPPGSGESSSNWSLSSWELEDEGKLTLPGTSARPSTPHADLLTPEVINTNFPHRSAKTQESWDRWADARRPSIQRKPNAVKAMPGFCPKVPAVLMNWHQGGPIQVGDRMESHIYRRKGLGTVYRYRPVSERSATNTGKLLIKDVWRDCPAFFNREVESVAFPAPEAGIWVFEILYVEGDVHSRTLCAHTCSSDIEILPIHLSSS